MKQHKKMKLDGLNIKSFVTSLDDEKVQTINGGLEPISGQIKTLEPGCGSGYHTCYTHLPTEGCTWGGRCTDGLLCGPGIIKI